MSDEAVKKQIEGVCSEISEKNGWTSFAIDVGTQYPVRLQTKLPALIDQARSVGQQRAVWTYKESQGNENPNKPGTYYMNRYLEGAEVGGTVTETPGPSPSQPRGNGGRSSDERGSIERQVIIKEMVQHYPNVDSLSVDQWWGLMGELEEFLANGVPKVAPAVDEHGATAEDIPF